MYVHKYKHLAKDTIVCYLMPRTIIYHLMTGLIEGQIIFVMTLFLYLWIIIYQLGVIAVKKFLKKIFIYCALCVIRIEFKALYHVYITIKINVRLMFLSNKNSLACLCCYLTPLFTHRYHMQSTFSHLYLK